MQELDQRIQLLIETRDLVLVHHNPEERNVLPRWWRGGVQEVYTELAHAWHTVAYIVNKCDEQIRELKACLAREEPSLQPTTSASSQPTTSPSSEPTTSPSSEPTMSPSSAVKKRPSESQDDGTQKRSKMMGEFA